MYALKYSEWWWESLCCSVSTTPARLCVWKDGESARPVGLPGQSLNRRNRMWCNWYSMVDWCWTGSDDRHLNVGLRCVKTLIDILEPHVDDAQTSGITIVIIYSPINALVKNSIYLQGGPKIGTFLYGCQLHQILTNFQSFSCPNQNIRNNTIAKDPTTPQMCRYTTLWNVNVLKQQLKTRFL